MPRTAFVLIGQCNVWGESEFDIRNMYYSWLTALLCLCVVCALENKSRSLRGSHNVSSCHPSSHDRHNVMLIFCLPNLTFQALLFSNYSLNPMLFKNSLRMIWLKGPSPESVYIDSQLTSKIPQKSSVMAYVY